MALSSTFQDRLKQMEETLTQRLGLLQAEEQIQISKLHLLAEKLANERRMEQRCLLLDRRSAELGFHIIAKKSEIDALNTGYQTTAREIRDLKASIGELEEREKEKDLFYEEKSREMKEFKNGQRRFSSDIHEEVQKLRTSISELKSAMKDIQGNNRHHYNTEIAEAEARKLELSAEKEGLNKRLTSAYELRALLHKQLEKKLVIRRTENMPDQAEKNGAQEKKHN